MAAGSPLPPLLLLPQLPLLLLLVLPLLPSLRPSLPWLLPSLLLSLLPRLRPSLPLDRRQRPSRCLSLCATGWS